MAKTSPRPERANHRVVGVCLAAALAAGCGLDLEKNLTPEQSAVASDAIEAQESATLSMIAAAMPALPLKDPAMVLADAVAAQSNVPESFEEPACMSVTIDGADVDYALDNCTGPWGRVVVSGTIHATFRAGPTASSFEIELSSDGLSVNGRAATFGGTVLVELRSAGRDIAWQGSYEGKTRGGKTVSHETDLALTLGDDGSAALDGTTASTIGVRGLNVEYALSRPGPKGTCLVGTVDATTKLTKVEVGLTFDGTTRVTAENSRGGSGTFTVDCTPAP